MKIVAIESQIVSYPPPMTLVSSSASITAVDCCLVTVRADEGLDGFGYAYLLGGNPTAPIKAVVDYLGALIIGLNPLDSAAIWERMWRSTAFIGPRGIPCFAIAAIDTALWDIKGKAAGCSVARLLGATTDRVPAYYSGLFLNTPIPALVEEAQTQVSAGWQVLKMRLGAGLSLADNEARVRAVREAVGDGVTLLADVSRQLDVPTALDMGRMLQDYRFGWFEDPVPPDELDDHAAVAAALDIPIASGEMAYSRYDFKIMLDKRFADIWMPDLERVGGITEWLRVGAMAAQAGIPISSHVFQEISVHVLAALPTALYLEYLPLWEPLFHNRLRFEGGAALVPMGAGLDVDVDWDFVARHRSA
jgi:L-alanine-DL-glutamate epimerase-like enolase superfamily enzyme